jgi:hypothetical protein
LASPENIRLGLKNLPGANALASYENPQIMDVKSFITLAARWFVFYIFHVRGKKTRNEISVKKSFIIQVAGVDPIKPEATALPVNIRLGWKSFPGKTLAYYKNS